VGPFDFITHSDTSLAKDTAVVVHRKPVVGGVYGMTGVYVVVMDMRHTQVKGERLQFTMTV
jgi:hypothetical protein